MDRKMTIVGVMKDFHYGKVENLIEPVAFMFWTPGDRAIINAKIQSTDMLGDRSQDRVRMEEDRSCSSISG